MFGLPPWLVITILILAWIPFFAAIMMIVARIGGWRELADKYPQTHIIDGTTWRWQHLGLRRGVSYNMIVTVAASAEGVRFHLPWMFRAGHRAIFLPWNELTITRRNRMFGVVVSLQPAGTPHIPVHMTAKLAEKLKAIAGEAWNEKESVAP
jgi:hypothetical protein